MTKDQINQTRTDFENAFKANQPEEIIAAFNDQTDRITALLEQHERLASEAAGLSLQLKAQGAAALTGDLKKLVSEKMVMGLSYDDAFQCATRQLQHDKNLADEAAKKAVRTAAATPATKGK